MRNNILKVKTSRDFIDSIIKCELLKKEFNLDKNPMLFILITNRNEFSDYMIQRGYSLENLAKYYNINLDKNINLINSFNNYEIDELMQKYFNDELFLSRIKEGYTLECADLYENTFKEDNSLLKFCSENYILT